MIIMTYSLPEGRSPSPCTRSGWSHLRTPAATGSGCRSTNQSSVSRIPEISLIGSPTYVLFSIKLSPPDTPRRIQTCRGKTENKSGQ